MRERKWKYTYEEREATGRFYCCDDCGLDYGCDAWVDVGVSNEDWEKINPTYDKGSGTLCFNCMARRFKMLGLENIEIRIRSSPFVVNNEPFFDQIKKENDE